MRRVASIALVGNLALGVVALLCGAPGQVRAASAPQQFDAGTYQAASAKAAEYCTTLWSDHAFDPLRDKIPLPPAQHPTSSMLINAERVGPEDKPLADLALKTAEKCNEAFETAWLMLPPPVHAKLLRLQRQRDALNTQLSKGKITFGEYNQKSFQLQKQAGLAFASLSEGPGVQTARSAVTIPELKPLPSPKPTAQNAAPQTFTPHEVRIALVIGESRYENLPKLLNPEKDARSVAETLQKMGYNTQLLLDASEDGIRKEIRKFASESNKADVAVVFYAGHGAQLNGSNYLLPIDIDIPHTEADIQFAGLKVYDLINSIRSNTKIVFLDACRDNPALFKNLVNGRGSTPVGLAPASASSFNPTKPGGGIFIAYATDAGAVADDGHGEHSPFTQALLRNMQEPISIDDMFSKVTKEVRFVTKNAQRPFKYASLENIICLTPACSGTPAAVVGDIVQQATQSEDEELQIALQTKNSDALETYLQKYPETKKRSELLSKIAALKRSELTEWTLYEVANQHLPQYIQLSSIQMFENRAAAKVKMLVDPSQPKVFYGKPFPDAAYVEELNVYDCTKLAMATAEDSIFDKSGNLLYHFKWADPQYLNLSIGIALAPGSVGSSGRNIACHRGGPLLGDTGNLIGVNSFKAGGEGLNFAVSVDEVRKFIGRAGNRIAQAPKTPKGDRECKPKQLSKFRSEQNDATVVSFDMFCTGKDTGELVTPDDQGQAIFLRLDRNGDGHADVIIFDLKRSGRWDLSFWDENFTGHWTLVGYHDDGSLKPTRFESYDEFQKRVASR